MIPYRKSSFLDNETEEEEYINYDDYYTDYGIVTPPDLLNYTISFVTSGCFYWDVDSNQWVSNGCQVSGTIQ